MNVFQSIKTYSTFENIDKMGVFECQPVFMQVKIKHKQIHSKTFQNGYSKTSKTSKTT